MKHNLCLGVVYLLIAISSVHSASYLYRFGREVVVPSVNDEVKEIVSELKKDEPVVVVEELAAVPNVPIAFENVEQAVAVKNVPANVVSTAENVPIIENNLIAAAAADAVSIAAAAAVQPAVPSRVINEEARAKPNSAIRFDELEVIQPSSGKSEKVQTVADTVKSAAVQAIEKQNEEIEKAKPVEPVKEVVPVIKTVPAEVVPPVKSIDVVKAPEQSVVPAVKDESAVAPVAAVPKVEVEKLVETVRSAEPEPVKQVEIQDQKVETQDQKVQVVKTEPELEKAEPAPPTPERQDSAGANPNQPPNPLNQIQTTLNQITTNFQNALNGIIANCKLKR